MGNRDLEVLTPTETGLLPVSTQKTDYALEERKMEYHLKLAEIYAASELIPSRFRRKPNDCFVAIQMSDRLGTDIFMFMQNTYIVHGTPGFEGKFIAALVNTSGLFTGNLRFKYEGEGKTRKCTAYAINAKTGEVCEGVVDIPLADRMGWTRIKKDKTTKKDLPNFWLMMPDMMLCYRSSVFFARINCPEVTMGMKTTDEIRDIYEINPEVGNGEVESTFTVDDVFAELESARSQGNLGEFWDTNQQDYRKLFEKPDMAKIIAKKDELKAGPQTPAGADQPPGDMDFIKAELQEAFTTGGIPGLTNRGTQLKNKHPELSDDIGKEVDRLGLPEKK